ncbi:MAG: hypothetical protein R2941_22300 [Desulfobacterales bacterium]
MSFRQNLLKKIQINKLAQKIRSTIAPSGSEKRMDLETMRSLLEMGEYAHQKERDLDLYILEDSGSEKKKILVLDNDLPIYHTAAEDVAMRKSPTVKEMLNIRNAMKILNDKDVVLSKKEQSLESIRQQCIDRLDLSFSPADLDEIEKDGAVSLERAYADGVTEALDLFAELLGYVPAPEKFRISNYKIMGHLRKKDTGELLFGPAVLYSLIHSTLRLMDQTLSSLSKEDAEMIPKIAAEKIKASQEGAQVFAFLKQAVLSGTH